MNNIIAIREKSTVEADKCFSSFMRKTESVINERSKVAPSEYRKLGGRKLEDVVVKLMKELAESYLFDPNKITLVSGQYFPDIVAETFYGVEVKTTEKNHWTSTGSSIIESTRISDVENIYLLFGKLGGPIPEFRCKPYGECMSDIAVTHSPRYLIDMELGLNDTIFAKMGTTYDKFREDPNSIEKVRAYYRRNRKTMPWWIGNNEEESTQRFSVRLWNDSSTREENSELIAKALILFPEILDKRPNYANIALWLCTKYSILLYNTRDVFSASGKVDMIDGRLLKSPIPHVISNYTNNSVLIQSFLTSRIGEINEELRVFRPDLYGRNDIFEFWLKFTDDKIQRLIHANGISDDIPFVEWFKRGSILSIKKKYM